VYLRSISIRGFKSFPDPVEIRLEPGVAVVVGPNGSGKSNIADALLWAAGSLAPSELRAERPDDVLFAGSSTRPPAAFCEVELRFEEVDGALTGLDYSEVVVARRLHRSGESRYLVNGVSVRRADVVELLAEVGLGPGGGAVVGQGKVEAILASSPAERRALVEEAAGLGRFKRRRHRAELKLARVAQQVERARDLEAEAQRRLRPLALQASAAERAEKLSAAIRRLQAGLASLDLAELAGRLEAAERERAEAARARRQAEERLQAVLAERGRAEEELAHVAGGREGAAALLYRLRSAAERVGLRREAATELAERARRPVAPGDGDDLAERIRLLESRAAAVEQALAEREGLPPAARVLAEQGERLLLSLLHVQPGRERAVAAALRQRASALVADSPEEALALARRAREEGLGSLVVLVHDNPAELVDELPLVDLEGLLASPVPAVTVEGFGYDPEQRELWFAGETAEAFHLELAAQARRLRAEAAQLRAGLPASAPHVTDPRLLELSTRLQRELTRALAAAERLEGPLRLRAEREGEAARELAGALRRLAAEEAELRRLATEAAARATAARRRLQEAAAEPAQGERGQLEEELRRLERRREALGAVNPFAQEEYGREKARLDHLREQRADLERSLQELEALRRELDETVERRFAETFARVRENFAQVAATLFPGGQGQLRLSEPQGEEKEPGIEVELRPAGKRVTRLSLLSGGEKALGAIAFLFALFLARPCPFYLLDEVEAALDDTNIGRFVELLRRFADRAQFIVVTHQKRTMEAADVLYGVSMGADGVSQVVSRRLPREEAPTAA
jgi:chromosome segregation protein